MSWRNVGLVYRKELIDSLRDRRTLISMIAVPILLMPALTVGVGALSARLIGRAMQEVPTVMVLGGEDSPHVLAALHALHSLKIVPARPDYAQEILTGKFAPRWKSPPDFEATLSRGDTATVRIYLYEGELKSGFGVDETARLFSRFPRAHHS